jgi:site-specific recombinase XerC
MINRQNWQQTKKYLDYRLHVDQISGGSMDKEKTHLRYLLEWAQDALFSRVTTIRPTFPEFLLTVRLDGKQGHLSAVYLKKVLSTARLFFTWLSDNEPGHKQKQVWIKTLRVKRLLDVPKNRDFVTLEEILAIARAPVFTIRDRRARAALCFLYLSGIRIDAFVSLTFSSVNIEKKEVYQFPSLGVRTKNRKHAVTYLLDIPELLEVVQAWHDEVWTLGAPGLWFPILSSRTGRMVSGSPGLSRSTLARREFRYFLARVGLPYHSPHKFRHGHVHFGLERCNDMADFKAVSLNVMHSSVKTTDEFYSVLSDNDVRDKIAALDQ